MPTLEQRYQQLLATYKRQSDELASCLEQLHQLEKSEAQASEPVIRVSEAEVDLLRTQVNELRDMLDAFLDLVLSGGPTVRVIDRARNLLIRLGPRR